MNSSAAVISSHAVFEKFDNHHFLLCEQQIIPVIKGHRLYIFDVNLIIPTQFSGKDYSDKGKVNEAYDVREQQDQLL